MSKHDDSLKELRVQCKPEYKEENTKDTKKKSSKRSRSCADIAERLIDIHKGELMKKAVHMAESFGEKPPSCYNGNIKSEASFPVKEELSPDLFLTPSGNSQVGVAVPVCSTAVNNEDTETYNDDECPTICLVTPEEEENLTPEKEREFTQNISTALLAYLKKLYSSENSQNFHQMMNEIFHDQLKDQEFIYWLYKRFQS